MGKVCANCSFADVVLDLPAEQLLTCTSCESSDYKLVFLAGRPAPGCYDGPEEPKEGKCKKCGYREYLNEDGLCGGCE